MVYFVSIIHALTCIFIVLFILLQDSKGGVLGSIGGGSKSFFGSDGVSPFLVNVTKCLAIVFACSSFYLSYMSAQKDSSLMSSPETRQEDNKQPADKNSKSKNKKTSPETKQKNNKQPADKNSKSKNKKTSPKTQNSQ